MGMARSLQGQLRDAFQRSGLTIDELIERSGLELDTASLSRKIRGKQTLRSTEIESLASALGVVVSTGRAR
jgi:hypothetical protein